MLRCAWVFGVCGIQCVQRVRNDASNADFGVDDGDDSNNCIDDIIGNGVSRNDFISSLIGRDYTIGDSNTDSICAADDNTVFDISIASSDIRGIGNTYNINIVSNIIVGDA
jgi:hypothetical protein